MPDMLLICYSFSIKKLINEIMEKKVHMASLYQHLYNIHKLTHHACVSFKWIHMHL